MPIICVVQFINKKYSLNALTVSGHCLGKGIFMPVFNTNIALGCLQQGSYIAHMMDYLAPFEYKYVSNVSNLQSLDGFCIHDIAKWR